MGYCVEYEGGLLVHDWHYSPLQLLGLEDASPLSNNNSNKQQHQDKLLNWKKERHCCAIIVSNHIVSTAELIDHFDISLRFNSDYYWFNPILIQIKESHHAKSNSTHNNNHPTPRHTPHHPHHRLLLRLLLQRRHCRLFPPLSFDIWIQPLRWE